ncbi:pleiomorphic adenoma gene X [Esox lucius]|uniref:C2H2-type domain-containing protein n=1 Tax=Esox lucius TaxID=8010 RepID=A0AAY5K8Q5_ESOLU|nr:pleiomorphic adenoma gene X [Esox lucius]XP_010873923.1 pleiomorphic adenoma gene X [Esox lucius]
MFQQKEHLKSHLQAHHANRQVFHCQECGKQYSTQLGYRRHLLAAHTPAPSATLSGELRCQEGAPTLLEQIGSHGDRPPPPTEGAAVRERKYSCERCDRRFYTRKDVRRHAVVHTGRRDFLCPRCAQRFGRRDHLTRHLKKSHAQEAALAAPAATPAPAAPGPVKEELSPVPCSMGTSKEPAENFPMDMYGGYPLQGMSSPGMGHHHQSLMQGSLSTAMGRQMTGQSPHHHLPQTQQQQQPYMTRYQHGSTSYPRTDMESFLMDLQSGLPPHMTAASSSTSSSPQREVLSEAQGGPGAGDPQLLSRSPALSSAELSCAANMDLGPLLGFLPFGLPPYSAHMSMGGLVMGYPSTSTSTVPPSSSSPLPSQGPGGLTFLQPPQPHAPQGPGAHNQLPQGFSHLGMSTSPSLPRYYQAFQQ